MQESYKDVTDGISTNLKGLRTQIPDVLTAFSQLSRAATADGVLDKKTKEFIALALSVASHCDGCIGFHTQALARLGATREEVAEVLGMAVYMGGGPSLMYAADARQAFEEAIEPSPAMAG